MKTKLIYSLIIIVFAFIGCSKEENKTNKKAEVRTNYAHQATVLEVIHVTEYTYLRVKENDKEYWIAAPKADIKEGTVINFNQSMEMKNFESKDLKRKFDTILFVDNLDAKLGVGALNRPMKPNIEKENIKIKKAADGITIAELFANPKNYENKIVKIKGKVVKINSGIMNKNWIHIQDGTNFKDDFDLTITSNQIASIDEIITVTGKIILNKDFGYGYSYKILMEDAKIENSNKKSKMMSM
ncbi:GW dipeptide domain-containing protein [Stygiobacter electus]|uniref:GW dipeptide domain-containing protein n=1 Tax=Stygiobacter electus TaxID=3032292 RepID=A0AAE3TEC9_9BACT|nr:GW dipeptide domain-containing protein [Stygiobacter electus]MDF1612302.1 GW dipeptide domain-containing protein [Stygiobacter electus]